MAKIDLQLKKINKKLLKNDAEIIHYRELIKQIESSNVDYMYDLSDQATIVGLAVCLALRDELMDDVRENGTVYENKNSRGQSTYVQNPCLTALASNNVNIRAFLDMLYLNPKSKVKTETEKKENPKEKYKFKEVD